jgi:hypothetical protein
MVLVCLRDGGPAVDMWGKPSLFFASMASECPCRRLTHLFAVPAVAPYLCLAPCFFPLTQK